jgi:chromosomal replication initiation ATPase DnaA
MLHREDPNLYSAWFAALQAEPVEAGVLVLAAPSRFHADYLRTNHMTRLERAAMACDAEILRVVVMSGE